MSQQWFFLKRLHDRIDNMKTEDYFKVHKLHEDATYPTRGSAEAGAYDLYSPFAMTILPGQTQLVALGIACDFPCGQVAVTKDRSSMAGKNIFVVGGVMDSDYRGEWKILLHNASPNTYHVEADDRVAQVMRFDVHQTDVTPVARVEMNEGRGKKGFGSTGR